MPLWDKPNTGRGAWVLSCTTPAGTLSNSVATFSCLPRRPVAAGGGSDRQSGKARRCSQARQQTDLRHGFSDFPTPYNLGFESVNSRVRPLSPCCGQDETGGPDEYAPFYEFAGFAPSRLWAVAERIVALGLSQP